MRKSAAHAGPAEDAAGSSAAAPPLPDRRTPSPRDKTSPRDESKEVKDGKEGKTGLKAALASKSAGSGLGAADESSRLTQSAGGIDPSSRKSAFAGVRMMSHPQKKQSLANIFFMSSPLVKGWLVCLLTCSDLFSARSTSMPRGAIWLRLQK